MGTILLRERQVAPHFIDKLAEGRITLFQMALQGTHIHPQGLELVRRLDI
ncbi:hypothetical protein [Citrobacter portucalensis]